MSKEESTNVPPPSLSEVGNSKLCHIVKRPDFDGYGFNLHSEKSKPGQFIGKVDPKSPAELAGLKEGDRIIEVNGVLIGNETHKQVVQRIKSISCEVRLLLIDADGCNTKPDENGKENVADLKEEVQVQQQEISANTQEMPGASANISSITMTTTKRISNASSSAAATITSSSDVTDRAIPTSQNGGTKDSMHESNNSLYNNNNNSSMKTPPPPSAATASVGGGLQLPTTAAEMRAKLLSRKKYDPKNESVDLKKKFEIIQKL